MNNNSIDNKVYNKNRWLILAVLVTQPFMACLDSSIVNVALPTIGQKLSITMSSAEWIVSSYLIIISSAILIFGRLGDMKGKCRVFLNGILVFVLGSLLCGISASITTLVISRIVQAIGAAMVMSTNQGIITDVFPPNERGRALGISGSFVALGSILGPALGGFIITYLSWHYIFLINIPIGIAAYLFGKKHLPMSRSSNNVSLDKSGASTFVISTILIFSSIMLSQQLSFSNIYILLALIFGIIIFALFIVIESKVKNPMLDLSLFKTRSFSVNLFCAFISFAALSTVSVIQPFYLSDILKFRPSEISWIMISYPIVLFIVAPLSGSLSDKIGSKKLTLLGLLITSIALFLMSFFNEHSSKLTIVLVLCLLGFSNGLFQSPNTNLIMSSAPKNKLGIAGGTNALVRNLGLVFGVSLSTSILYYRMSSIAGYRVLGTIPGRDDLFVYGMKGVYILAAIACLIAFALSLIDKLKSTETQNN